MDKSKLSFKLPLIGKLLIPLIIGVILGFYTSFKIEFVGILLLLFPLILIGILRKNKNYHRVFGLGSTVFFFCLGVYLVKINTSILHPSYFIHSISDENDIFQVQLTEEPEVKENSIKCFANVLAVNQKATIGTTLIYFKKSPITQTLQYGDVICLQTKFTEIQSTGNPNEFNYADYLNKKDIYHQAYVRDSALIFVKNEGSSFVKWLNNSRNFLINVLDKSGLKNENLSVAKALILGEKSGLDRETMNAYSASGTMHVLAVSGLHVGIVMLLLSFFLKPLKNIPKGRIIYVALLVVFIWLYALLTGLSPSVMRATFMFTFVIMGKEMERDTSVYQSIMVSAFLLILMDPMVIFDVGFQLSYLAVIGIVFFQPKIYKLFFSKYYLVDKVWQITSVSIAAQLATVSLGLFYFHQFPNLFLISNLIAIPISFAILMIGLIYLAVNWVPLVNDLCFYLLDFSLTILNKSVQWIEQIPYSIYSGVWIHWYEAVWHYLIIIVMTLAFIYRKAKFVLGSMVMIIVLLCFTIYEKMHFQQSNQLVIYNIDDAIAIDVFEGQYNTFRANQTLLNDKDKLTFHVKPNWNYRKASNEPNKSIILDEKSTVFEVNKRKYLILNGDNHDSLPKTETVILYNCSFLAKEIVDDFAQRKVQLIIGDNVNYRLTNFLKKRLIDVPPYLLKEEGAYIVNY
jgi:competence protein ComEC